MKPQEKQIEPAEQHNQAFLLALSVFSYMAVPFLNIILPLYLYSRWKDANPIVEQVGKRIITTQVLVFIPLCILGMIVMVMFFSSLYDLHMVYPPNATIPNSQLVSMLFPYLIGGLVVLGIGFVYFALSVYQAIQVYRKKYDKVKLPFVSFSVIK